MDNNSSKKRILLIITGSIAAYKSLDLIRDLKEQNIDVTCVLTKAGEKFVTPLTCTSLSGNPIYSELFSTDDENEMGHIRLSREHDLLVVAPASADIIAKMAHGLADDLASTLLLATDKPVLVAPAMNVRMWTHKATQRNITQLKKDGISFVGPEIGNMACGEEGEGRMAEPATILKEIMNLLQNNANQNTRPLRGMKMLVTSGPTVEAIDPVRYITNRSSGKQGHAIATIMAEYGADVTLVSGPTTLPNPDNVNVVNVESAREMLDACENTLPVDAAICTAAVSDWRIAEFSDQKIKKKSGEDMAFNFMENPDILECLSKKAKNRPPLMVGFAAETEDIITQAQKKLHSKNCDWILANDVANGGVFGSDNNKIHFIADGNVEEWPILSKNEIAKNLAEKITEFFTQEHKLKIVN